MTLQIGMVGTDGILLAGDTQWTPDPELVNEALVIRAPYNSPKIKVSHESGVAVAFARNLETSEPIASRIVSELQLRDWVDPRGQIEKIGREALQTAGSRIYADCLIATRHPEPQLFMFQFGNKAGSWAPMCQKITTHKAGGDNVNGALFWLRYYSRLPVEQLVPLAAQLITSGQYFNSGTISGLEIVLVRSHEIKRLSEDSIRELESQCKKWESKIERLFLGHKQQFTYAPDVIS